MKTFVGCYKLLPKFAILMVVLSRIAPIQNSTIQSKTDHRPTTDQQPTADNKTRRLTQRSEV
jgi:hypothetical protein